MAPTNDQTSTKLEKPSDENTVEYARWRYRKDEEHTHRIITHMANDRAYTPNVDDIACLTLPKEQFADTCNKTVPMYFIPRSITHLLKMVVHNYVYRRWLQPWESELDWQRFLCKPIVPHGLPKEEIKPSSSSLNTLVRLNQAICEATVALRDEYKWRAASGDDGWKSCEVPNYESYILQPLFRAIMIVVSEAYYLNETSEAVGKLPVFLIRTGVEDGLSAPITFDAISDSIISRVDGVGAGAVQTTLETAIDFIIGLEEREVTVFGFQPNPLASWQPWPELLADCGIPPGDEYLHGPTSKFVDANKFSQCIFTKNDENTVTIVNMFHNREHAAFLRCALINSSKEGEKIFWLQDDLQKLFNRGEISLRNRYDNNANL